MRLARRRIVTVITLLAFLGQLVSVAAMGLEFQVEHEQAAMPSCHSETGENQARDCCDGNCSMMLCHSPVVTATLYSPRLDAQKTFSPHYQTGYCDQPASLLYRPPISS